MKSLFKTAAALTLFAAFACSPLPDSGSEGEEPGDGSEQLQPSVPGPDFRSAFRKNIALWEFTGAWCANCPEGYTNMNFILTANPDFTDCVHPMAFHSNAESEDDLAIAETPEIMNAMNMIALGFPSYNVDMTYGGSLVSGVNLKEDLYETMESNLCCCGVAVSSVLDGAQASVTVRLHSEINASWRVCVYVVEDKVKYHQNSGGRYIESYTHRHVVRRIVSESFRGDRIGGRVTPAGTELTAEYTVSVDAAWNKENTYIYVLAIDSEGHVNNMNLCGIDGGDSGYDRL